MEKKKMNELLNLAMTVKDIQRALKRFAAGTNADIPTESLGILLTVHYSDTEAIQQDIADIVKKDKSAVLRQIDNLEKKNLVQRIVAPNDRRRNIIHITDEGLSLINEVNSKLDEMLSLLSDGLEASDLDIFYKVLSHFRTKAKML
jgi:Transcriptional regulators